MNRLLLITGLFLLFLPEALRVYLVMPFPGSQIRDTVVLAHWINVNIIWTRLLALALVIIAAIPVFKSNRTWQKIALSLVFAAYTVVFFCFNFRMSADRIFLPPVNRAFSVSSDSLDKSKLVIGVVINGEARAYPIQLIGYHHQIVDTVGNTPVMVTYCTVCRTGRVFSPIVNGNPETFRLVGMDHYNAVFEDAGTKSWWQQATGIAITGPLKGTVLKEFTSRQLPLQSWLREYPNSLILEPDMTFSNNYFKLEDYDKGLMYSDLVRRDAVSWREKSWIIGVKNDMFSKAYDWNELVHRKIIQDSIAKMPILLAMESDTTSFHVYDRRVNGSTLLFRGTDNDSLLTDRNTNSVWNMDGLCIDGALKGQKLVPVQAYNEFWHAWKAFNANAEAYRTN